MQTFPPGTGVLALEQARVDSDASKGWFRRLWPVIRARKGLVATVLAAAALGSLNGVAIPWFAAQAIDTALAEQSEPLAPTLWLLGALALMTGVLGWTQMYSLRKLIQSLEYDLRTQLFDHLSTLSFSFYDRMQTGQLISRANADIRVTLMFMGIAPMMGISLLGFSAALGLMLYVHWGLTLLAVITLPGVYFAGHRMRNVLFPISWAISARMAELATVVEENVTGARIVKSFAAEGHEIGRLERSAERMRQAALRQVSVRTRFAPLMENLPRVSRATVLLYGGWLAVGGEITIATLLLFNSYILRLQMPFRMLAFLLIMAQRAAAASVRVYQLLDTPAEIADRSGAVAWDAPVGEVELRGVRFGYAGASPDAPAILDGLDLHMAPGETVALVGRTGCGKSTLARLLPRFYDVGEGAVLLDGRDVRDYELASVRRHIGLVLDEPFLFSESIRDNIAYGRPDAPFADIEAAARVAGAHEFIARLPESYETVVGERGYTLSGGQRQRVAIARTLLINPKVLVLDDATSAIDVQLEQEIHASLERLMVGRTTLIVAHRLSTIRLADRVALLEKGRIVATGSHDELMRTVPEYADILSRAEAESRASLAAAHEAEATQSAGDAGSSNRGDAAELEIALPALDLGEPSS